MMFRTRQVPSSLLNILLSSSNQAAGVLAVHNGSDACNSYRKLYSSDNEVKHKETVHALLGIAPFQSRCFSTADKPIDPRINYPYTSLHLEMMTLDNPNFAPPPRPRPVVKPLSAAEMKEAVDKVMKQSIETTSSPAAAVNVETEYMVRVSASYLGSQVDLTKFANQQGFMVVAQGKDYSILLLMPRSKNSTEPAVAGIMTLFSFGSAVFFNTSSEVEEATLQLLTERYVSKPVPVKRRDDATVILKPALLEHQSTSWFTKEPDRFVFAELDNGNIELLGRVLGQSVALDHYHRIVDGYLKDFGSVLGEVAGGASGSPLNFRSRIRSAGLMQTLCASSVTYTEVISKLGLLDQSATAWKSDRHNEVWKVLREEYELESRLEHLSKKLVPIQEVAKFIVEVRRDRSSAFNEKVIIFLIMMEIVIALTSY